MRGSAAEGRRVDEGDGEANPGGVSDILAEAGGDSAGILEIAELRMAGKGGGGERHHRNRAVINPTVIASPASLHQVALHPVALQQGGRADRLSKIRHSRNLA